GWASKAPVVVRQSMNRAGRCVTKLSGPEHTPSHRPEKPRDFLRVGQRVDRRGDHQILCRPADRHQNPVYFMWIRGKTLDRDSRDQAQSAGDEILKRMLRTPPK